MMTLNPVFNNLNTGNSYFTPMNLVYNVYKQDSYSYYEQNHETSQIIHF